MPRKYIKRSDYWNKFSKASENRPLEDIYKMEDGWQPTFEGEPYYVSQPQNTVAQQVEESPQAAGKMPQEGGLF